MPFVGIIWGAVTGFLGPVFGGIFNWLKGLKPMQLVALIATAVLFIVIWTLYSRAAGAEEKLFAANVTIGKQAENVRTMESAVNEAKRIATSNKAVYDRQLAAMQADLAIMRAGREAAERRAKKFDALRKEIDNAPAEADRPASSVLVATVNGVSVLLRGRSDGDTAA